MVSVFPQSSTDHPLLLSEAAFPVQPQPTISYAAHTQLDNLLPSKYIKDGFRGDMVFAWLIVLAAIGAVISFWFALFH